MANPLRRTFSRSRGAAQVADFTVNRFSGLVTNVSDSKELEPGVAISAKNWLTGPYGDHIELRPGTKLLGQTRRTGAGKVTGMGVGVRSNGTQVLHFSFLRKILYYDAAADDTTEVSTANILPAAASGEDISFSYYSNIAGAFMYASSPNSSIYKIPVANPGSVKDQASADFRGKLLIKQNRSFLWDRKSTSGQLDKTGLNLSYIDKTLYSAYTQVTGEAYGTGNGVLQTFAHTLAAVTATRTAFSVTVTDGTETFLDDKSGGMVGSLGGTGTVNYATGAVSVTFASPPANLQAITTGYYWEDPNSQGVTDFSFSATRTAGQGNYYRQDDGGGNLMSVMSFNGTEYCFHLLKTWALKIGLDDTGATNLIYRARLGIPYWRAAFEASDGVVYLDYADKEHPTVKRLHFPDGSTEVVPESLSDTLNLSAYAFDYAVIFEYGNYYLLCCQEKVNGVANPYNSVMFAYNKIGKTWDQLDYYAACLAILNGKLEAGDSISNNVFELFSGFDDDGQVIDNYWISNLLNLGAEGKKRVYRFEIDGYINVDQTIEIYLAYDNGSFTKVGQIDGTGSYVDLSLGTMVGSTTVGQDVIGSSGTANAYHFKREFTVASDIFEYVQVKLVATEVGAAQANYLRFKDIRYKGRKALPVYNN